MRWILLIVMFPTVVFALPDYRDVKFVSCHDGDTCKFMIKREVTPVRLAGIDAPEIGRRASKNPWTKDDKIN